MIELMAKDAGSKPAASTNLSAGSSLDGPKIKARQHFDSCVTQHKNQIVRGRMTRRIQSQK
jgi:hypothetical protein